MADIWKTLNKLGRYGGYGGLRKYVLDSITESPKNGVEIIDFIEKLSYGAWKPSPGSIYPLLSKLTEDGIIRKRSDGRYEIAEGFEPFEGAWQSKRYTVDSAITEIDSDISYLEDIRREDLSAYEEKLGVLGQRLLKIRESLRK
jgi:DNA-binding PadR family transcriptional regulator